MAPEGKERKRKAGASSIPVDLPHKKSKNTTSNNSIGGLKNNSNKVADDISNAKNLVSAPVASTSTPLEMNEAVIRSKKSRKRAADFMSENDDDTAPQTVAMTKKDASAKDAAAKSKKKSKKGKADDIVHRSKDEITATADLSAGKQVLKPKAEIKKGKKGFKTAEDDVTSSSSSSSESVSEPTAKKRKPPTQGEVHDEKINTLLDKDPVGRPRKGKDKKRRKGDTLTAGGSNGVLEHSSDEELELTTAKDKINTSLQAEAQRTVDQEMEDEFGFGSDDSDELSGSNDNIIEKIASHESFTPEDSDSDGDAGVPVDDNAADLLAGFDSDDQDAQETAPIDPTEVKKLKLSKEQKKNLKMARKAADATPGAIYVGRVPHGFYEHQMREYFSQFGTISKLRLSRNRTTGASKHFAFIEFESDEVAKIAAAAMDNYLMFGHTLKCKYAPANSLHPDVWKGSNKRFRKIPYNKIEKLRLEAPKTQEHWEKKITKEQKKREAKNEQMKALGYKIELPKMKKPSDVLEQKKLNGAEEQNAVENVGVPTGLLEAPKNKPKDEIALATSNRSKKDKKKAKLADEVEKLEVSEATTTTPVAEPIQLETSGKKKKNKVVDADIQAQINTVTESKKGKAAAAAISEPAMITAATETATKKKTKLEKKQEEREKERAAQAQLDSQLNGDSDPIISETVAITDEAEKQATAVATEQTRAVSGKDNRETVNGKNDIAADGLIKRKRNRQKKKSADEVSPTPSSTLLASIPEAKVSTALTSIPEVNIPTLAKAEKKQKPKKRQGNTEGSNDKAAKKAKAKAI